MHTLSTGLPANTLHCCHVALVPTGLAYATKGEYLKQPGYKGKGHRTMLVSRRSHVVVRQGWELVLVRVWGNMKMVCPQLQQDSDATAHFAGVGGAVPCPLHSFGQGNEACFEVFLCLARLQTGPTRV